MQKRNIHSVRLSAARFILASVILAGLSWNGVLTADASAATGQQLFEQNCAACHHGGGNVVNPKFTLHKKTREEHGVKTVDDIVHKMRHPGPGMPTFTKQMIPDSDAKKIAQYIIKTF